MASREKLLFGAMQPVAWVAPEVEAKRAATAPARAGDVHEML